MAVYFKSAVYLGIFGTAGYFLMVFAEPSEEKKRQIARTGYSDPSSNEIKTKKAQFLEKLKEASTDTPIYLKKSTPRGSSAIESETPKQPSKREIN